MPQATFRHGSPVMVDYTPGSAVTAGDVIVTSTTPRIAHLDIASGVLGALAAEGGVYEVTGDAAIAADKKVYWDDTNNKVTETSTSNKVFGVTVTACSADAAKCLVRHDPVRDPMGTLFDKASTWLPAKLEQAAGVTVTVTLSGESATVTAVIGQTVYAVNRPDGARVEFGERDFFIDAAALVLANPAWTEPVVGMRFQVEGEAGVYECKPPDSGGPPSRWSGPDKVTYRIHTVEVGENPE